MKKRWTAVLGLLALLLSAVLWLFHPAIASDIPGVTGRVTAVSPSGMTYEIKNYSGMDLTYSPERMWLEKRGLLGWYKLPWTGMVIGSGTLIEYIDAVGETRERTCDWTGRYGRLGPGDYRLLLSAEWDQERKNLALEFRIS